MPDIPDATLPSASHAQGATTSPLRDLLNVLRPTPADDPRAFHRGARRRVFSKLLVARLFIAPAIGVVAGVFAFFEPTPWRRAVLGTTILGLLLFSVVEWIRSRNDTTAEAHLTYNLALMACAQLAVITSTGGLVSPVVPGLVVLTLIGGLLLEPRAMTRMVVAIQIPALWVLAAVHHASWPVPSLIPEVFGGAQPFERGAAPWFLASVGSLVFIAATQLGDLLRGIFDGLHAEAIDERDRALAMHAEHGRALGALSAELAHELKNPLASVKGLAALVARSSSGKSAERLGVLRREVDRMQEILDELLNFSRPLVPLSTEEMELRAVVGDVALLFEATAADRQVELHVVPGPRITLRCDPRKVRQVLINLVQNALDASPEGAAVAITLATEDGFAQVRVRDRGDGIAPAIAERVFEAGATSKEHGSGLGLSVARSLSRQHGGELTLDDEPGGGAVSVLTLPVEGLPT